MDENSLIILNEFLNHFIGYPKKTQRKRNLSQNGLPSEDSLRKISKQGIKGSDSPPQLYIEVYFNFKLKINCRVYLIYFAMDYLG